MLQASRKVQEETLEFIPFAKPCISQEEIDLVVDTLKSGWLTTGPRTKEFEDRFQTFVGADHAIAVNSATAGLHLALEAIGIGPGDKIITSPLTFTATAEVMRYLGADPVFVDCKADTYNIDVDLIEDAIRANPEVKAIMPVHYAGQACDMDEILDIAKRHNLRVIEDAAHALPTRYKGRMVGTMGDITVYSFYVTKTLATGEGGMIVTNDEQLAKRMKIMRLHGISKDVFDRFTSNKPKWHYEVIAPGYKYNLTDVASSLGIPQLAKAYEFQKNRSDIAALYAERLADLPLHLPSVKRSDDMHSWHLYVPQLQHEKTDVNRDVLIELMSDLGIGLSVHYMPLHLQPYWRDKYNLKPSDFPVATDLFSRIFSLPIYPSLSEHDLDRITNGLSGILG